MNGDDDIEMLAAEYVIGTLGRAERDAVAARRMEDAALDAAITSWESELSPLLGSYASVPPPEHLKQKIADRIRAGTAQQDKSGAPRAYAAGGDTTEADNGQALQRLQRKVSGWRAAAAAGYALAAGLAGFIITDRLEQGTVSNNRFVAVFQSDDAQPAFVMSLDLETRQVLIRPVTARPAEGKTYQLWIKADKLGDAPRSLGLLDDATQPVRKSLPYDPALLQEATFGISLEPPGGSPTGTPTGPAIHGKLISTGL